MEQVLPYVIIAVVALLSALGVWTKVQNKLKAIKEWADVVTFTVEALADGNISDEEKEEFKVQLEEAKAAWKA